MNLTIQLQKQLDALNSGIKLSACFDGSLPAHYAFFHDGERRISTEFAATPQQFSIVLYERKKKHKYENCFARGTFDNLDRLANIINLWISQLKTINEIGDQFNELELFTDFAFKNPNPDIEKAWRKVKNMRFNDRLYWKHAEWDAWYQEMLIAAKQHDAFKFLYPFTSHYALRFSKDKELRKVWTLFLNIEPSWDDTEKAFKVSYNEKATKAFDNINEALDFLAAKMIEIKPLALQ